ncbi:hypothetical protein E1B28_001993 [Marasmius oreades]|uniref:DUF6534 domain-containing protein n=1 Tax=Marasmius oreades TaxID=181124 RepID=A0A9P7V4Q8_9AGAR|nr:uncharacterized protein E1B28_001993 [Marasmius oreades]KAG7100218.1 hypothetical protein E1B28_001993 [Marasmius oreades]
MSPVAGIPSDVRNISGPLIITFMLGSILYGVQVLQVYIYYLSFPKDRKIIKSLVYIVFLLDTTQSAIFFRDAFTIFGAGFGDMAALRAAHLSGISVPILTGSISLIVQCFYCYQIQVISRSWILTLVIISIAITQFVSAIIEGVSIFEINNSAILQQRTLVPCTIWLVGSALCDTIIAVAMTAYLFKASSGFRGNAMITRLVRLIIETGTLTASVAIIDAVLFISVQKYPFHMIPSRCLAKLYSNTLMVILNSRTTRGSRDTASKFNHVFTSGWGQSVDIRFAHSGSSTNGGTQRTISSQGGAGEPSRSSAPRTQLESLPKLLVPLGNLNLNVENQEESPRDDVELSKKVRRDSL